MQRITKNYKLFTLFLEENAICSKGDVWTFDGFQTKLSLKLQMLYTKATFFMTVLSSFFMKQTADDLDDFGGSHKNVNCTFPLPFALFNQGSLTFLV